MTAEHSVRVASYNIHRAVGNDRRRNLARISAVIGELQADVIGLQEVDWRHYDENRASQFEYLVDLPGYRAIAGANLRDHRGHYGNLLLTRLPVLASRRIDLSEPNREPRGAIDVDLDVCDGRLRVLVTHLGLGPRERGRQVMRLQEAVGERPGQPTLLIGDFNEWIPSSPTLRPLLTHCVATTSLATFPAFRPILPLDRIFACAFPFVPRIVVHRSPLARLASDHLPLTTEIDTSTIPKTRHRDPPTDVEACPRADDTA